MTNPTPNVESIIIGFDRKTEKHDAGYQAIKEPYRYQEPGIILFGS